MRATRCWLLLPTVLIAVARAAAGEHLPVRTLTTADGLPRDQLACVVSDERGFVWFCTADGLVRWDGHQAVTFGREDGLLPPGVRSFLKASDGRYWIGGDAGLFEFLVDAGAGHRFRPVRSVDGRDTGGVNALIEAADHTIWCAAGRGLFRLEGAGDQSRLVPIDIGLPDKSENDRIVRALVEDERGSLWIGAGSGLYRRRAGGAVVHTGARDGFPVDEVRSLAIDHRGRLWAGTRAGLALLERGDASSNQPPVVRRIFTAADGLPATNIIRLRATSDALWIGTVFGVVEATIAGDLLAIKRKATGFYAWDIAVDAHGDVWVASEAGARHLSQRGFTTYDHADGLAASRVSSLFETRAGELCATTLVGRFGLSCFDGRTFHRVRIRAAEAIQDSGWGWSQLTLQDSRGRWWIPTGEGLLRFDGGSLSSLASARPVIVYDSSRGLMSSNIFRLFEDSAGAIWVATFTDASFGIARIDTASGMVKRFTSSDGLPDPLPGVHAFAEDRHGNAWVGLEEERLLRYRAGRFEEIPVHSPPLDISQRRRSEIRSVLVDARGRVWIASTASGLGRVDNPDGDSPAIHWFGAREGLASNTAWMLAEHGSGDLFVGTPRGIDRFQPSSGAVVHYSAHDGVPRGEIWGALRDRLGRIWFATTDGATVVTPIDERAPVRPVTLITGIRIAGVPLPVAADGAPRVDGITVQSANRRVEIDFVSPGAREADGLLYQHRLQGLDTDWTTTSARTVALAGAASGRYEFLVRAVLANGEAGDPAHVQFTVMAPVWRRPWFLAAGALLLAALAVWVHRLRVRRLLEIERVRSRIAADLHDGVGASLSRIAILSEVVRQRAESALPDAVPALASIADNARGVIDAMSDAVWSIDPHLDNLNDLLVRVRATASELFEGRGIVWTIHAPPDPGRVSLTAEQRRHLLLIIKEGLTNVLRHAHATEVIVRLAVENKQLHVDVTDDGVGATSGGRSNGGGGRGIDNMRARAVALGGTLTVGTGSSQRGTRLSLTIPLTASHENAVGGASPPL